MSYFDHLLDNWMELIFFLIMASFTALGGAYFVVEFYQELFPKQAATECVCE